MKKPIGILVTLIVFLAAFAGSALATEYTHIWIDQENGINDPCTLGTEDEPFKSITYALARADYLGWTQPWHVHIGPGVYDANSVKPASEREIFPIELGQDMIFESTDPNNPDNYVIDGQHLVEGFASLLYGNDLTGLEIRGLTFRNMDHSQGNGGAIELIECAGKIENCIIQDNSAQSGGGLWLSPRIGAAVPFDFIACTFSSNTATNGHGGGAYVTATLTSNISDCTFTDNSASREGAAYGGGFYIVGDLIGNANNCTFTNNSCNSGGIYASAYGSGFYIGKTFNGNVTECRFTNNSCTSGGGFYGARSDGGGFYIADTLKGNITGCSFENNYSKSSSSYDPTYSYGGGFYIGTLNGTITGCYFAENSAQANHSAYGGGFYIGTLYNNITNCGFSGNCAENCGGGFYVGTMISSVSDCSFIENAAPNGGGFRINGNLNGKISRCDFDNGISMASDLAVQVNGTFDGTMENCRFYDFGQNAVRLLSNSGTAATIRSCLFVAPVTLGEVSGWAIRTDQNSTISNNTMVGPGMDTAVSPSAIYIGFDTQAENGEIFNNIIVDSKKAIHVNAGLDMPITYNQFYNVEDIVCQGEQCLGNEIWWLEWNLSNFRYNDYGDPLFFAYDAVYHIQETSPCVDAGDPNYVAGPNETDIDGQPRVAGYAVDKGADEYLTYLLTADIYHDGIVNFLDYAVLTSYWQQDEPLADIAPPGGDGIVDFLDLRVLVNEWLLMEPWY